MVVVMPVWDLLKIWEPWQNVQKGMTFVWHSMDGLLVIGNTIIMEPDLGMKLHHWWVVKVEKIQEDRSPSVKIQIIVGKVWLK